jgi:hypothetical protein
MRREETGDCCLHSDSDVINPQWLHLPSYILREMQNQLYICNMSKEIVRRIGMIAF